MTGDIKMQPNGLALRRVALCVLFVCSIVAIFLLHSGAAADEITDNTVIESAELKVIELEVQQDANEAELRDDKIALFVNYVQVSGVTTELEGSEVYAPVRFFAEAMLDCKVIYSSSSGRLTVRADGLSFEAICGNNYVVANERYLYIEDGISLREDGQIWLPVSLMAKIFGCEYSFETESKSVYLTPTGEFIESGDTYYNQKSVYWLSRIINAESRGEPFYGQLAVGTVVLNRVDSSRYPNTIYDVIFDGRQFSPAVSGSVYKAPLEQCVIAAKIVLEGYRVSDNILYFHSISSSYLYDDFDNTDTEMVIGNHYFYTTYKK